MSNPADPDGLEARVTAHYSIEGMLGAIRDALRNAGVDPERATPRDLAPFDQLHTGGAQATADFIEQLEITPDTRVLDIGCGIGGPARHIAATTGAHVTGVDLTPGFVAVAQDLSRMAQLGDETAFVQGSALDLPLGADTFDLAVMIHVGMNIEDKATLFAQAARVLRPGGRFALFDVMRTGDGALRFPLPWAEVAENSFVASPDTYRDLAERAGFMPVHMRDRRAFAIDFFTRALARAAQGNAPPPAAGLMMRGRGREKIANYLHLAQAGDIAPVEMVVQRPG